MTGFGLHPEAYDDIDEIREYIAEDNPAAAHRIVTDIFDAIAALGFRSLIRVIAVRI